ncbi:ribonuclease HII [Synechococcus elongatus]|uniref:Ribonuclease HII n=1 Tax=Synechococcus elongatus PCC 11801 TaxID=2219813 RepID=A0AAN1QPU8_SYNEL|nr:ribonuclease HII [Synechococcus elongatus]AZB73316.1 ribonuclease HII [Synechococcus elongatus PCC 11801]
MSPKTRLDTDFFGPGDRWQTVAGIDEVGRGCLFGPVVAAAVVLPEAAIAPLQQAGVTDSKQLSQQRREQLYPLICETAEAVAWGLSSVAEIERWNILQATFLAMRRALAKIDRPLSRCLIDGNQRLPKLELAQTSVVQGDRHCVTIAAASILAKVWRDRLLERLDDRYPDYGLRQHKGYGTAQHRQALLQFGPTPLHRPRFLRSLLQQPKQISLF